MATYPLEGPDTSYAQGNVNPANFPGQFARVNASRANVGLAVGSKYHQQIDAFRADKRHLSHYFFNGNLSPTICATFFANNLYDFRAGDHADLDVEDEPGTGTVHWNPAQVLEFDDQFFRLKGRHITTVYLNKSIRDMYDWSAVRARGIFLWLAWYNPSLPANDEWGDPLVWQYTSAGYDHNRAQAAMLTVVAGSGATPIPEDDMGLPISFVPDAQSATIWVVGPLGYVGVRSVYHLTLLQRAQKNTGSDKMLQAEMDIVANYLITVGAVPNIWGQRLIDSQGTGDTASNWLVSASENAKTAATKSVTIDLTDEQIATLGTKLGDTIPKHFALTLTGDATA